MYIFIYIVYTHPCAVDSVGILGPRKRSSNRDAERRIKKMWLTEKTENRVNFNNTTPNNKSMCILCRCVYNLHKVVMLFWMDDALLPSVVLHFFTFFILFFFSFGFFNVKTTTDCRNASIGRKNIYEQPTYTQIRALKDAHIDDVRTRRTANHYAYNRCVKVKLCTIIV